MSKNLEVLGSRGWVSDWYKFQPRNTPLSPKFRDLRTRPLNYGPKVAYGAIRALSATICGLFFAAITLYVIDIHRRRYRLWLSDMLPNRKLHQHRGSVLCATDAITNRMTSPQPTLTLRQARTSRDGKPETDRYFRSPPATQATLHDDRTPAKQPNKDDEFLMTSFPVPITGRSPREINKCDDVIYACSLPWQHNLELHEQFEDMLWRQIALQRLLRGSGIIADGRHFPEAITTSGSSEHIYGRISCNIFDSC